MEKVMTALTLLASAKGRDASVQTLGRLLPLPHKHLRVMPQHQQPTKIAEAKEIDGLETASRKCVRWTLTATKYAETLAKAMTAAGKTIASFHITRQLDQHPKMLKLLHQRRSGNESPRVRAYATTLPSKASASGVKDVVSSMARTINARFPKGNPGLATDFAMGTANLAPNVAFLMKRNPRVVLKAQSR
jgi:hypothetical protein